MNWLLFTTLISSLCISYIYAVDTVYVVECDPAVRNCSRPYDYTGTTIVSVLFLVIMIYACVLFCYIEPRDMRRERNKKRRIAPAGTTAATTIDDDGDSD